MHRLATTYPSLFQLPTMGSNNHHDDTPRCSKGVLVMFLGVFALGMLIVLFSFSEHAHSPLLRTSASSSFFDLIIEDAKGNSFPIKNMITHPGAPSEKLYLITNLASNCGLTYKNYPELQKLYERYQDRGFEVLGFPCNDFKEQEPGIFPTQFHPTPTPIFQLHSNVTLNHLY